MTAKEVTSSTLCMYKPIKIMITHLKTDKIGPKIGSYHDFKSSKLDFWPGHMDLGVENRICRTM